MRAAACSWEEACVCPEPPRCVPPTNCLLPIPAQWPPLPCAGPGLQSSCPIASPPCVCWHRGHGRGSNDRPAAYRPREPGHPGWAAGRGSGGAGCAWESCVSSMGDPWRRRGFELRKAPESGLLGPFWWFSSSNSQHARPVPLRSFQRRVLQRSRDFSAQLQGKVQSPRRSPARCWS